MLSRIFLASHGINNILFTTTKRVTIKFSTSTNITHFTPKTEFHNTQFIENHNKLTNAAYSMAALIETDLFGMITNGLGRLANRGEAGYNVKVTKSFHSLVLKIKDEW